MYGMFPGASMFNVLSLLFPIAFLAVLAVIVVRVVQNAMGWSHNRRQPKISAPATIVAKRMDVSHHHHANDATQTMHASSTTYYATFEFSTGDRQELRVPSSEYGMLSQGDRGTLTLQGTRFIEFSRNV